MTIYELNEEIGKILDEVDSYIDDNGNFINTETGEVIPGDAAELYFNELQKQLNNLAETRDEKISNIACWIKQLEADAEAIKKEKLNLAKRQKYCENKATSLRLYLGNVLQGEKFKNSKVNISYRSSKSVEFAPNFDYSKLPEQYQKITYEPKKTELKNAILNGEEFEGVWIQDNTSMQIK